MKFFHFHNPFSDLTLRSYRWVDQIVKGFSKNKNNQATFEFENKCSLNHEILPLS